MSDDVSSGKAYGLLGIPVDAVSMDEAVERICRAASAAEQLTFATPNLNFLRNALDDPSFRASLLVSDLSLIDGAPLLWLSRLLGVPAPERVAGSSLFERLRSGAHPLRIYFFGGTEGAAESACASLAGSGPLECAGFEAAGFGSVEELSMPPYFEKMNATDADLLVVALGAGKGQAWIMRNRDSITIPVVSHLGAVINFASGRIKRAPSWLQRLSLEWLWRIIEEPSLWRRYLLDGAVFLRLWMSAAVPYAYWLRRHRASARDPLCIASDCSGASIHLTLDGALSEANRSLFEGSLARVEAASGDISLDLRDVTFLDPAGLGYLLRLEGMALRRDSVLRITNPAPVLRSVFRWNAMTHLLA